MGGMGFIQSNHSRILYNSTMISFNVSATLQGLPWACLPGSVGLPLRPPAHRHRRLPCQRSPVLLGAPLLACPPLSGLCTRHRTVT